MICCFMLLYQTLALTIHGKIWRKGWWPFNRIYINKTKNRITFKIKTGYYLKLLIPETTKLLESTKSKITKDENSENVPHLEFTEIVLVRCNIINNDYQQASHFMFLKTFDSEFSYIAVWFTDQNSKPLEIEDKKSITLVIN